MKATGYTIFIVDDETDAQLILKEFIRRYCQNVEIAGVASTIKEAKDLIEILKPDILLLDISLKEGTGFDLLDRLGRSHMMQIIFTTAYDQHAIEAFKVRAVDYLLKPIDPFELKKAIDRCAENITIQRQIEELNATIENHASQRITLPIGNYRILTNLSEIIRCQSDGNYTKFHFCNRQSILVAKTLKEFDLMLKQSDFLRIHQSHLVNKKHITSLHIADNVVLLSNGERIPISRRKKSSLLKEMNR